MPPARWPYLLCLLAAACSDGPVVYIDGPLPDAGQPAEGSGPGEPPATSTRGPDAATDAGGPDSGAEAMQSGEGECSTDTDCTSSDEPRCDTALGECVDCLVDADCRDDSHPFCTPDRDCVECRTRTDCAGAEGPACQPDSGECVECQTDADCLLGLECELDEGSCEAF